MRRMFAAIGCAAVIVVAMTSPPERVAAAAVDATPAQAPAPTPAPPRPPDCSACMTCIAGCGTAYAACTAKCASLPDLPSQQACIAGCPPVTTCAAACPCSGCPGIPGLPH